jgi:hypothetical protein
VRVCVCVCARARAYASVSDARPAVRFNLKNLRIQVVIIAVLAGIPAIPHLGIIVVQ